MSSVTLGPVALPLSPLLVLLAVWASSWLASLLAGRLARRPGADGPGATAVAADPVAAGNAVLHASVLGLVAARASYLATHAAAYAASPLAALDIRDGGWHAASGIAAGLAWLLWRAHRAPPLRAPLAVAAGAGLVAWALAVALLAPAAGQPAPSLRLVRLDGAATTLAAAAGGRPAVVNLWATWCGPCREEMPVLADALRRHPDVAVLFVNQGEAAGAVQPFVASAGLPVQAVLLDAAAALGPAVGSRGLPTTLFVDGSGHVQELHFGVLNAPALQGRIERLQRSAGAHRATGP